MNWRDAKRPFIIGHRGASADAPENTLAAMRLAQTQGADGIEFDVQLAADGVPVVIHDATVTRTTNGQGHVAALSSAALAQLDAGNGEPVPTLSAVFETCGPHFLYNVELKTFTWRDVGLETAVAAVIKQHGLAEQLLISSFNPMALRRIRPLLPPSTPMGHLRHQPMLHFKHRWVPAEADHPHHKLVNKAYMAWAREKGLLVNVWTVDEVDEAKRLFALGITAVITNTPSTLRHTSTPPY